ncbi:nuclear transport factor 2 family protein [Imperialibacter roseus]|uniref:Nuclear transport factor 2 family protein n=1 Tax=Imperialibacter roseus TaxID=1324217 RepID=A0ABZ0IN17_9BACT|nr:nuclear transport factor 2 family protein [Imperialibacter roseus]WOK04972.1 nuclear transport factor 2 family protein [Imperialibacter roseus]|tara:strand:+ start:20868 stop:21221 length:354 start_codon:yes stop_codon:yes gene_type:complete
MSTLLEKISDLNDLVLQGKAMEAFERYYHEDVVMQENETKPTVGKAANRRREEEFFAAITEFRGAKPLKVAVGESVTMVEWHYDYTHKDWGTRNYTQISVQEWRNGQIVLEKFYYGV